MHLMHSYRNSTRDHMFTQVKDAIKAREQDLLKESPEFLANLVYTFANCRLPARYRQKYREINELDNEAVYMMETFGSKVINNADALSKDTLIRFLVAGRLF